MQSILQELNEMISDIEKEMNSLDKRTKKLIANNVYSLGSNYLKTVDASKQNKFYAFVIKKSFFFNKISFELMSSEELPILVNSKYDDYKIYKNKELLNIFDEESLVKIKYFLLSFGVMEN